MSESPTTICTTSVPDLDHLIRCAGSIEAIGDIIAEIGDNPRGDAMQVHAENVGWLITAQIKPITEFLIDYYSTINAALKPPENEEAGSTH